VFTGVAAGVAAHLGISVIAVRLAFVALAVFGSGLGAVLYAALWAVLPVAPGQSRRDRGQVLPFIALGRGALRLLGRAHESWQNTFGCSSPWSRSVPA